MVIEELTTVADERTRPSSFEELFLVERSGSTGRSAS
jgi:hypothetical protein